ncbi:MAG TPA: hypothetical protein VN636_18255, partial [Acidimicrobiia bacterium]|nr:hypothetical protein [Acidimicrobiia bacterium]
LEAAVEAYREGIDYSAAIAELDLAEHDREHGSRALIEGGYLTGQVRRNTPDKATVIVQGVTEKARRATKAWPQQQAYDDLLTLLEAPDRLDDRTGAQDEAAEPSGSAQGPRPGRRE